MPTVEQQNAGAFNGDIGITSPIFTDENCEPGQRDCARAKTGGRPEIDEHKLARVTFYTRTLAVPARRDVGTKATDAGERVFERLGCDSCHLPELRTGDSDIAANSDQLIRPYTDLLVHDMGPGLADGRPDGLASGSEWRTAPLWGIGLVSVVNRHTRFLHDGRARNLAEAILWHGGEAHPARERFRKLPARERRELPRRVPRGVAHVTLQRDRRRRRRLDAARRRARHGLAAARARRRLQRAAIAVGEALQRALPRALAHGLQRVAREPFALRRRRRRARRPRRPARPRRRGHRRPVIWSVTMLAGPPSPTATTGRPLAWASSRTWPNVSVRLAKRKMSALAYAAASASPSSQPRNVACSPRRARSRCSSGPPPASTRCRRGSRERAARNALASRSAPFSRVSRPA